MPVEAKVDKDKKRIIAGAGVLGGLALLLLLLKRGEAAPPPPPGKANMYGQVTDDLTGQPIEGIEVSFAEYAAVTQPNGYYLIESITPGGYEVTFHDPLARYETMIF